METPVIRKVLVLSGIVAAISFSTALAQDAPHFHFTQPRGAYAVGLKVVEQYDTSRTWGPVVDIFGKPIEGERARPLQTLIWYPAERSSDAPMTVGDYFKLLETETSFGKPHLWEGWNDWKTGLAGAMSDTLWSVRDARPVAGHFPIVIYAPSFGNMAWENVDLCEYLASHGYIVVAAGALGAQDRPMTGDLAGINAQARDISFLVGYAQKLPNVDPTQVAVAGFSWGGISNLFAAAHDSRITALVAMDGSMRYYPGLVKDGDVHPDRMTIPLLFFTQGEFTLEDQAQYLNGPQNQGPSVLNAWTHGDLITVRMLAMIHIEYSSVYQRNENSWKHFATEEKADYGRDQGIPGYAWMARYTLDFLNAYLKHNAEAMDWLKKSPVENGAPQHFFTVNFRAASGPPQTYDSFRLEVGKLGFDHIKDVYADFHKQNADFKLNQDAVDAWGYELLLSDHLAESIDVLELNAQLYPDSGGVYRSLGEAYAKAGKKDLAIQNFHKALEKDSNDTESKHKLEELEKPEAEAPAVK
jgi:hypothetical protein